MTEMLYAVRCLKSNEYMILALAGKYLLKVNTPAHCYSGDPTLRD